MAKRKTAARPAPKRPDLRPAKTPNLARLIPVLLVIALAGIPFAYGKYLEFGTNGAFDGGMNVYTAQAVVNGGKVGTDVTSFAAPATLLTNVVGVWLFGFSEVGPKLIQMLMQIVAMALMFYTLRKFYGAFPAVFAVVMAAFFLSCPPFAKFGNVKEQFMIACMIVAACGLMLGHAGGSRLWLILSGAVAVNTYYYKQTGASIIIAMAVYLIAQPVFRHRTWRQFASDVLYLLIGGAIGLMPLLIFYTWQGRLLVFVRGIPGIDFILRWCRTGQATVTLGGEYIAGSRHVTNFASQYSQVVTYYHSFVIPIGLCLLAIVWRLWGFFKRTTLLLTAKAPSAPDQPISPPDNSVLADRFVLLLGLWWLIDMAFVWVSPRAYVEYFLPPNGSAAMLGAYALWRCRKQNIGWPMLLAVWIVIDMLMVWLAPVNSFPWLTLASSGPAKYWGGFVCHVIAFIAGLAVCLSLRRQTQRTARTITLTALAVFVSLWWIGLVSLPGARDNVAKFRERVTRLSDNRRTGNVASWEQIGHWIKDNSSPDDGIYVWGWYPGIYVAAQRFCPATRPAYSDMHSDRPGMVRHVTQSLVNRFREAAPRYIVDSQKMHYPFYDHPLFDLWLYTTDENRRVKFMPARKDLLDRINQTKLQWVEDYSFRRLTDPKRRGGPLTEEKARAQAQDERARHEAMLPLREFVILNYRPVNLPVRSNMLVFEYKGP